MSDQNESIRFVGEIEVELADAKGVPVGPRERYSNLVMDVGKAWIMKKIQANSPPSEPINYIGFGASNLAPASTQTTLTAEVLRVVVGTFITTALTGGTPGWSALVSLATSQANTTIAEVGLFTSNAGGTMISRVVFTALNKQSTNTLNITYTFKAS